MAKEINDEAFSYISQHHKVIMSQQNCINISMYLLSFFYVAMKSILGKRRRVDKPPFKHAFYVPMLERMASRVPEDIIIPRQEVMAY